jgi:hypothetical protein
MIKATAVTDDGMIRIEFDAEPYFQEASENDLWELYLCDFRDDLPADSVAVYFSQDATLDLFTYLDLVNKYNPLGDVGFECCVNRKQALEWIDQHRPNLWKLIQSHDLKLPRT